MSWWILALVMGCGGGEAQQGGTIDDGGRSVDPETYHYRSVHGTVTGADGKPLKRATMRVLRSDGKDEEASPLGADGRFVFHIREENSGPPPWQLTFAAPKHASQTVDVPGPPPEEGLRFDIALERAR